MIIVVSLWVSSGKMHHFVLYCFDMFCKKKKLRSKCQLQTHATSSLPSLHFFTCIFFIVVDDPKMSSVVTKSKNSTLLSCPLNKQSKIIICICSQHSKQYGSLKFLKVVNIVKQFY